MIALTATPSSGAAGGVEGSTTPSLAAGTPVEAATGQEVGLTTAPETCPYAELAIVFYRGRYIRHQMERGVKRMHLGRNPYGCRDARWLARVWVRRAHVARIKTERWKTAQARRLKWSPSLSINHVFGSYAGQAHRVASCESGHSPNATNGQYLGMFQMGNFARAKYGHGPDPLTQARAAYRYFVESGRDWSPWSCKPW